MLFAKQVLVGRVLQGVVTLGILAGAVMKFIMPPDFVKGMQASGVPLELVRTFGVLEIIGIALYLVPRSSLFGAIWMTGYLGGAIMTDVRVGGTPLPAIGFALLMWVGYGFIREDVFRAAIAKAPN
jgi:hypothetical protein